MFVQYLLRGSKSQSGFLEGNILRDPQKYQSDLRPTTGGELVLNGSGKGGSPSMTTCRTVNTNCQAKGRMEHNKTETFLKNQALRSTSHSYKMALELTLPILNTLSVQMIT